MGTDESFEEIFTDEYWQEYAAFWTESAEMLQVKFGEGSKLAKHIIDNQPTKPLYLTLLDRERLRKWYEKTLEEARRMAASFGTCTECGSANLEASVVPANAKLKPNVVNLATVPFTPART